MKEEELLDKMDAEIMDWFYETLKINFGVEMVQDSTELREIIERNLKESRLSLLKEIDTDMAKIIQESDGPQEWYNGLRCMRSVVKTYLSSLLKEHE